MSTQVTFKEISIRNFLSFGNNTTTIELDNYGSTLIQGENIDASSNNGAGKTTIINAICYALYNKPFDSISLQKLINSTNASKTTLMEVRLAFEKGQDEYEIYRCRGETFTIQVFMNGQDITLDSVAENDKLIVEIMGISYDLFTKIVIFSGNSTPFLLLPVSQQRSQIEELFKITLLTEKAVKLKEVIKSTEQSIAIQEAVIKEQENQIAIYNKQLAQSQNAITKWDSDRLKQIAVLEDQLILCAEVNMENEKALHARISELKKSKTILQGEVNILTRDEAAAKDEISKLVKEIAHLKDDKCPYCLQAFEGSGKKLSEIETQLSELSSIHEKELSPELLRKMLSLDKIKTEIVEKESEIIFPSLEEVLKAETASVTAKDKIEELKNAANPLLEQHKILEQHAVKSISTAEIDALKKELEHQQFLLKLLTDKNSFIRRKIISKTIPFLNKRLVSYTKDLGLPHLVKFDDDMSCTVSEYGRELDFGNLSSGEKKRVNLALSLAFRDVLHQLHSRINCLFIDEIDASLDGSGVDNTFKVLKQKTRDDGLGLWIISHRPEAVGRFDRSIIVRKENGFSRILDESGSELGVT